MSDYIEREAALAYPIRKDKCDRKHANKHFIFGIAGYAACGGEIAAKGRKHG